MEILSKKGNLMACICDPKTILEYNFLFRKFLMAYISKSCDISKKGNFDGWYKWFKNHFGIKLPFLVITKNRNTF